MQKSTPEARAEFTRLILAGRTAKAAAGAVGISEKTAGHWIKKIPVLEYRAQAKQVRKQIRPLITKAKTDPATFASPLAQLTDVALKLEKAAHYTTGGTPAGA